MGDSGKLIVKLEGKSGKIISIGCCFPPKFVNYGIQFGNMQPGERPTHHDPHEVPDLGLPLLLTACDQLQTVL